MVALFEATGTAGGPGTSFLHSLFGTLTQKGRPS